MWDIVFIYADNCEDCERMHFMINKAIYESGVKCKIHKINSDTQEAIDTAIKFEIDDLPACVIGNTVLFGKKGFTYNDILSAFWGLSGE